MGRDGGDEIFAAVLFVFFRACNILDGFHAI